MPGRMQFDFRFGRGGGGPAPRDEDGPLRILVMGDFTGRAGMPGASSGEPLSARTPVAVDVDTFERVMGRMAPRLTLPGDAAAEPAATLTLSRLEEFHPDDLFRRLPGFEPMRALRERLLDPARFAEAASEIRRAGQAPAPAAAGGVVPDTAARPRAADEDDRATLERLLGRGAAGAGAARPGSAGGAIDIGAWIGGIVAPHLTPGTDPFLPQYLAWVDEAISARMRALLHHPPFQALEAAWRGVRFLVSRLDLGEEVTLHLLDVGRQELAEDLARPDGDLSATALYRLLVEREAALPGGRPWGLLVGLYDVGAGEDEMAMLAALGAIASRAGGPFLAGARPSLLGCGSLAATPDPAAWAAPSADDQRRWRELRAGRQASWIGLALPRFLLRLPYGRETDPVERFSFEEMAAGRSHEEYLWGHPALACALLIGRARLDNGTSMEPGDCLDVEELPAHSWLENGASKMTPCAEVLLGERAVQRILERGLIPLLSHANSDRARVARFQSIADPPAPLSGPWGRAPS